MNGNDLIQRERRALIASGRSEWINKHFERFSPANGSTSFYSDY
jgi:hypothetical protein